MCACIYSCVEAVQTAGSYSSQAASRISEGVGSASPRSLHAAVIMCVEGIPS